MSTRVPHHDTAGSWFAGAIGRRRPLSGHRPVDQHVVRQAAYDRLLLGQQLH